MKNVKTILAAVLISGAGLVSTTTQAAVPAHPDMTGSTTTNEVVFEGETTETAWRSSGCRKSTYLSRAARARHESVKQAGKASNWRSRARYEYGSTRTKYLRFARGRDRLARKYRGIARNWVRLARKQRC